MNKIISFKSAQNENNFEVLLDEGKQTFWATEQQIASLFNRDRTVISKHLKNIFKEQELIQDSVCAKFAHTSCRLKTMYCRVCKVDHHVQILQIDHLPTPEES
mgnify:CR=1 FL=1